MCVFVCPLYVTSKEGFISRRLATVIFCVLVTRTDTFIPTRCCCSVLPSVPLGVCTLTWDLDLLPPLRVSVGTEDDDLTIIKN